MHSIIFIDLVIVRCHYREPFDLFIMVDSLMNRFINAATLSCLEVAHGCEMDRVRITKHRRIYAALITVKL